MTSSDSIVDAQRQLVFSEGYSLSTYFFGFQSHFTGETLPDFSQSPVVLYGTVFASVCVPFFGSQSLVCRGNSAKFLVEIGVLRFS